MRRRNERLNHVELRHALSACDPAHRYVETHTGKTVTL